MTLDHNVIVIQLGGAPDPPLRAASPVGYEPLLSIVGLQTDRQHLMGPTAGISFATENWPYSFRPDSNRVSCSSWQTRQLWPSFSRGCCPPQSIYLPRYPGRYLPGTPQPSRGRIWGWACLSHRDSAAPAPRHGAPGSTAGVCILCFLLFSVCGSQEPATVSARKLSPPQ